MGRKKLVRELSVYLNENLTGSLIKHPNGAIEFRYAPEWVENGFAISLSLPLAQRNFKGEEASFYFDNLLPENKKLLEVIAQKFKAGSINPFDILQAIGKDCVGALSFYSPGASPNQFEKMKVKALSAPDIGKKIRNLAQENPLGMDEGDFRISLAGAQEKMALLLRKGKWWEPKGRTPTSHILKKRMGTLLGGIDFSQSVDNEMISLKIAGLLGLKVCKADIKSFDGEKVLVVERFDRVWKDGQLLRIPQEDICQALGYSSQTKYERDGGPGLREIMELLGRSNQADEDRKSLFRLAMVNDLLHNTDGHAKNVSIYVGRKGFIMTPVYDILSAHFLLEQSEKRHSKLRSSWSVNGKFHYDQIKLKDWQEEAKNCGLDQDLFDQLCADLQKRLAAITLAHIGSKNSFNSKMAKIILKGARLRAQALFGS